MIDRGFLCFSLKADKIALFSRSHREAETFETQFRCFPLVLFDEGKFEQK